MGKRGDTSKTKYFPVAKNAATTDADASDEDTATMPVDVEQFQRDANAIGVSLAPDGNAGFNTRRWVREFQRGFAGGARDDIPLLVVDGVLGPLTMAAHHYCATVEKAGRVGWTSPNFRFEEWRTKNPNRVLSRLNPIIRLNRLLVLVLEDVRVDIGQPIGIISGFRDTVWNRLVGGATASQHLHGNAADISRALNIKPRVAYEAGARGIGQIGTTDDGDVVHMDVRDHLSRWHYVGSGTRSLPNVVPR